MNKSVILMWLVNANAKKGRESVTIEADDKREEMNNLKLVLLRHGESEWNKQNRFTGWTDVELSAAGAVEAKQAGRTLKEAKLDFDICYTSYLKRAIHTLDYALGEMDRAWLPVVKTWKLNERHYGGLQGWNKAETAEKYGEEQVKIWRRSYDIAPPLLEKSDERNPMLQEQYRQERDEMLPLGESLKDTIGRVVPYYNTHIKKEMENGKRVIITAHGNSLRALVQYFEKLSKEQVLELNIPTGIPLVYEFDHTGKVLHKEYLADRQVLEEKLKAVVMQGASSH